MNASHGIALLVTTAPPGQDDALKGAWAKVGATRSRQQGLGVTVGPFRVPGAWAWRGSHDQ